jgi:hypothetical protein
MSYVSVAKTLSTFTQNLIKVVEDGCYLATHEHTDADYAKWEQEVKNVTGNGTKDISDEAAGAARDRATFHLINNGMSKADAEKLVEQHLKKVLDIAEQARTGLALTWTQMLGAVTAIFIAASTFVYIHDKPSRDAQQAALANLRHIQAEEEQMQQLSAIVLSEDEFNMVTSSLFVPSAPAPVIQDEPIAAAPAPLPPPIAAVAAQPVEVQETNSSGEVTNEVTTTVEHAYRSLPREAQRRMVSSPPPRIDHDYNHENLNDCFHTDCLKGIDKQFHKAISITNGDGSATISVSVPR